MNTEEIIRGAGGMSVFQVIIMFLVFGPRGMVGWGMLMMSFAGTSPTWWCVPHAVNNAESVSSYLSNATAKVCPETNSSCTFVYSQDKNTIINKWDLVCESSTTPRFITSIQMGGVLTGAFVGGQSADMIGRKPTLFVSILLEAAFNLVAGFSISWQMFAALRFLIGMMIGSVLVVSYPYLMEFVSPYWRPICSALPFWPVGVSIMALSSWLHPDWSHQHFMLAAVHVPFLFGWFIVPESLRWLAVKGRLDDAEKVVDQMCRYNKREKPANTRLLLKKVAEQERKEKETGRKYTYIDLYRGWSICWKSLIIQFSWMLMSMVYYGISFGAESLSGNLYLNIFLVSVVDVPGVILGFFLNNKIGRRWSCFLFYSLCVIGSFGVVIATRVAPESVRGTVINILALVAKLGVGAGWGTFAVLSSETYPTVFRNLGYGAANTSARVGGIVAPYVFAMEGNDVMIPFIVVGATMTLCTIMAMLMPETKGIPLEDSTSSVETSDVFHTKL